MIDQVLLLVLVGVISSVVTAAIIGAYRGTLPRLFWKITKRGRRRWRGWKYRKQYELLSRELYLNEWVELTTGKFVHRGCAPEGDEIIERKPEGQLIALGRCVRCGEHGSMPRRTS